MLIASYGEAVCGLWFSGQKHFPSSDDFIKKDDLAIFKKVRRWLDDYFNGMNPEIDFEYSGRIVKLEKEIEKFIETEVKFDILSKRLQRLITKLNILYNVSIFHSDSEEKEKIKSQLNRAFESEKRILNELKNCYYILSDQQFKESLLNLISYTDYQIFKTTIRISHEAPDDIAKNLVSVTEFEGFNYVGAFENFIKEEISDLSELLPMIGDEYRKIFSKKFKRFLADLTYSEPKESKIFDFAFWESFFENACFCCACKVSIKNYNVRVYFTKFCKSVAVAFSCSNHFNICHNYSASNSLPIASRSAIA